MPLIPEGNVELSEKGGSDVGIKEVHPARDLVPGVLMRCLTFLKGARQHFGDLWGLNPKKIREDVPEGIGILAKSWTYVRNDLEISHS